MRVDVVTVFPQYLAPLDLSLIGRARREGLLDVRVHDLRDWAHDRHRTVDGPPAGGGAGMVMRPEPWGEALDAVLGGEAGGGPGRHEDGRGGSAPDRDVHDERPVLLVPTPSGERFTQATAHELAGEPRLVFACGRYEGVDARVLAEAGRLARVREVSLGDYVLCGGEVAVLVVVEAVARLLPGVVGNPASLLEESHADGLLEYPLYTRPATWRGHEVPAVLLSGDHARVARWRRDQQLRRTASRRPDLLAALPTAALDAADRAVLAAAGWDTGGDRPRPTDAAALSARFRSGGGAVAD